MAQRWSSRPGVTIPGLLDERADQRPDQVFLCLDDNPVTYGDMRSRSVAAANALADLGIGPGDRVGILMSTSPEWVVTWFGANRLGAVAVPVNTAYRGDFLANQLGDSRVSVMVADQALAGRVTHVAHKVPTLRHLLVRPDGSDADVGGSVDLSVLPVERLAEGDPDKVRAGAGEAVWNEPSAIFYTSGTTGRSKGALTTQHYLLAAARAAVDCWELQAGETVYAPLPLFHLSAIGSVLGPLIAGGTGVIEKVFSVHRTWDDVRRHGAAGILLAGAMVVMLWNLPPDEADRELPIRFISAAPVPKETYRQIEERYTCKIVTMYGLSEAFPITYAGLRDDNPPGASGRANPSFEVAIFDDEDREAPPGVTGEIVCRPREPHVMFETYDGRPEARVEQTRNLWFHTGDLGRMDEDGNLYYVDRKKDAMRRRGENISSFEVEQVILQHPKVAEVAAVGVPSAVGEDDVMVSLTLKPGEELDTVEFMDFCVERMPYFAVPRYVEVMDELPKNAIGRVLKPVLREKGVGPATWDREQAGYVVRR